MRLLNPRREGVKNNNLQAQIFLHNILILYRVYPLTRITLTESTLKIRIILNNLAHVR